MDDTNLPTTPEAAKAAGSRHYFTGKPCPNGHIARRFASNHGCVECLREQYKRRYATNPEPLRAANRRHVRENPEANRQRSARWNEQNPDKAAVVAINSSARKRGASGVITVEEWVTLRERYGNRCIACGRGDVEIGADHVVPISLGGANEIENIQPMCRDCNRQKNRRTVDYRTGRAA